MRNMKPPTGLIPVHRSRIWAIAGIAVRLAGSMSCLGGDYLGVAGHLNVSSMFPEMKRTHYVLKIGHQFDCSSWQDPGIKAEVLRVWVLRRPVFSAFADELLESRSLR